MRKEAPNLMISLFAIYGSTNVDGDNKGDYSFGIIIGLGYIIIT